MTGSLGRKSNILWHLLLASFRWTDNVETIAGVRLQRRADREPLEGDLLVYLVGSVVDQQDTRPIWDRVAGGVVRIRRRRGNGADRPLLQTISRRREEGASGSHLTLVSRG